MNSAVSRLLEVVHRLHGLMAHPLATVIVAALLAALLEQRIARRRTPDFSGAWRGINGAPPKIVQPPRDPERR